jgi:signal transduction histidine kinase
VSHELRTPLTAICGFSQLLAGAAPEHEQLVAPIERNANEMLGLVERLLDQARLEAGRIPLEPVPFVLAPACAEVVVGLGSTVDGTRVHVAVADSVRVVMDPNAFVRVLSNLVGNAVKYAPGGQVEISASVAGRVATVRVTDNGPGIAAEHQDRIFEPFYRVPGSTRATRGTGFGLSIVRRYVELHGGTVSVHSSPGSGTAFEFTVPAVTQES